MRGFSLTRLGGKGLNPKFKPRVFVKPERVMSHKESSKYSGAKKEWNGVMLRFRILCEDNGFKLIYGS